MNTLYHFLNLYRNRFFIPLLLCLSIVSCNKVSKPELPVIDVEANIDKMQVLKLSRFADTIWYIKLETIQDLPVTSIGCLSDTLMVAIGRNYCLLYNTKGRFLSKLANRGRGPGEYPTYVNASIITGKNPGVLISSSNDLFEYNFNGDFISKYPNSLIANNSVRITDWSLINDSLLFGYAGNRMLNRQYKAFITNKSGAIKFSYKNYSLPGDTGRAWNGDPVISNYKDFLVIKEQFNDTLFILNKDFELIPEYTITLGDYMLPMEIRNRVPMGEQMRDYILISRIFYTEDYLILVFDFANNFPATRFTPISSGPGLPDWLFNTTAVVGMYSRESGELIFSKPTSTDNPLFTTGLYNDIDCGPRFEPEFRLNDSTLCMRVSPSDLMDHIKTTDFKNSTSKNPEKKKEFEEFVNTLDMFDNPVLMFVTFK